MIQARIPDARTGGRSREAFHAPGCSFHMQRLGVLLAVLVALPLIGCSGQKDPDPSISALHFFQRGNAAYLDQDYPGAVHWYLRAREENPLSPDIAYNLGLAHYQSGAYELATKAFREALRLDPKFADAHMNLALALDRLYDRAAAHYHYSQYQALAINNAPGASRTAPETVSATPAQAPVIRRSPPGAPLPGAGAAGNQTSKPGRVSAGAESGTAQVTPARATPAVRRTTGGTASAPDPASSGVKGGAAGQPYPWTPVAQPAETAPVTLGTQTGGTPPDNTSDSQQGTKKWWIQDQKPSPW